MRHIGLLLLGLAVSITATAKKNPPIMGWSSWNTYGVNINEDLIIRQADAMVVKGLKDVGYRYINIDDGYFGGRDAATGQLLIHPTRFPNGLKPVVDHIHKKGLRAGIYSDAGHNTCGNYYNNDTIAHGVGLYEHDQQDCDFFFKELGFDFIKVDYCGGNAPQNKERLALDERTRYTAISEAIRNTGRKDVVFNVCRWDYPGTWVHDIASSWRISHDISAHWGRVNDIIHQSLYLSAYAYDGRYNDMDMLEVGRGLSEEEDKTHFALWCIMSSPLLIGCDMEKLSGKTLELLKNEELIALNQDKLCLQAYVAKKTDGCYILVKDIAKLQGKKRAVAVYNPSSKEKKITLNFEDVCLGGKVKVRDLFERKDLGLMTGSYDITIPGHGTRIMMLNAEKRLEQVRYEAETAYISDYQELKNNQTERTGIYEKCNGCSGDIKASWLGYSEKNDLVWRNIYSKNGGEYTMTIAYLSGDDRTINIDVNGQKTTAVTVNSGSSDIVKTSDVKVKLRKGMNTIRMYNADTWMPDIDYIDLKNTGK